MEFSTLNGYKVKDKKAIRYYDTVADMKADTTLKNGMYAKTKGYYSINDGGGSEYHITSTESLTEYYESLNNNLYANLVIKDKANVKQFGAKGDNISNDSEAIMKSINALGYANFIEGTYLLNIDIDTDIELEISSNENTILKPYDNTKPIINILCSEIEKSKIIKNLKLELTNNETGIKIAKPFESNRDNYFPQRVVINNINVFVDSNFEGKVIDLEYLSEINISDIYVKRERINDDVRSGTGIKISSCINLNLYNSSFGFLNKGIEIVTNNKSCEGITLNNVETLFNNYGIYAVTSSSQYSILNLRIMNCMIDQVQNIGILVDGVSTSSIINNWIGVNVENAKGVSLLANNHESFGTIISDNTIWLSKGSNTYPIYIKRSNNYNVRNTSISNNTIFNYLQKAIFIDDTNSIQSLRIINNHFETTSSDASNTPLSYNAVPVNCVISNCINGGSPLKVDDDIVVKNCINIYNIKTFDTSDITTGSTLQNNSSNDIVLYITAKNDTSNVGYLGVNFGSSSNNVSQKYIQTIPSNSINNVVYVIIPAKHYYALLPTSAVTITSIYGKYL